MSARRQTGGYGGMNPANTMGSADEMLDNRTWSESLFTSAQGWYNQPDAAALQGPSPPSSTGSSSARRNRSSSWKESVTRWFGATGHQRIGESGLESPSASGDVDTALDSADPAPQPFSAAAYIPSLSSIPGLGSLARSPTKSPDPALARRFSPPPEDDFDAFVSSRSPPATSPRASSPSAQYPPAHSPPYSPQFPPQFPPAGSPSTSSSFQPSYHSSASSASSSYSSNAYASGASPPSSHSHPSLLHRTYESTLNTVLASPTMLGILRTLGADVAPADLRDTLLASAGESELNDEDVFRFVELVGRDAGAMSVGISPAGVVIRGHAGEVVDVYPLGVVQSFSTVPYEQMFVVVVAGGRGSGNSAGNSAAPGVDVKFRSPRFAEMAASLERAARAAYAAREATLSAQEYWRKRGAGSPPNSMPAPPPPSPIGVVRKEEVPAHRPRSTSKFDEPLQSNDDSLI